jgi:hypothetical protein
MLMTDKSHTFAAELRTARAAGVAGIVFAVILGVVAVLWRSALPTDSHSSQWITDSSRRHTVAVALWLIPYAGIAFLWFIGVIRTRLGDREDRLFATAFLGSGLLFVAMLFTAAGVMGGLLGLYSSTHPVSAANVQLVAAVSTSLLTTFSIRMAAVFTLVVTTVGRRNSIVPSWLVVVGYLTAVVLLFAPPRTLWATLLFPVWVFLLSVYLIFGSAQTEGRPPTAVSTAAG